jgi:Ice-binding-like
MIQPEENEEQEMNSLGNNNKHGHLATLAYSAGRVCLALAFALSIMGGVAGAAPLAAPSAATAPGLGAAASFSALGKAGVTNTGNSVLSGNVGADNAAAITGFPPGSIGGSKVSASAVNQAEADASTADLALTAQAGSAIPAGPDLTGLTLVPGVYSVGSALLSGVLTLNGPGVYIFLASSDLTASGSVSLINGASPCNVFWHVTSNAAITGGAFVGTIIAGTSVTFGNGASLDGRALALTGNVTLINNHISGPSCGQAPGPGATPQPSYVDVAYPCSTDGQVVVTVGMSAGVIVYGLGAAITSATDTGANKIVRVLPFGHYAWNAVPPPGHYLVSVPSGVVDAFLCGSSSTPGATGVPTASATAVPPLIPVTGADLAGGRALAARQMTQGRLGLLGLGLLLLGIALWRKRE